MKSQPWRWLMMGVGVLLVLALGGCATLDASADFDLLNGLNGATATAEPGATPIRLPTLGVVLFKGTLESLNGDALVVSGVTFRVDAQTLIPPDLQVGESVAVKAVLLPDGTRYALEVARLDKAASESEFKFYGVVESISDSTWFISGESVQVDAETQIEPGIQVGSLVEVEGIVREGTLVARKIHLEDERAQPTPGPKRSTPDGEEEWFGVVSQIEGEMWTIGGRTVQVTAQTERQGNPGMGDLVKVHASAQADGTYLAREIEKIRTLPTAGAPQARNFEFYGTVQSMDGSTWVISGVSVSVDANTRIMGNPVVGSQVEVKALVQADGTYLAVAIKVKEGGSGRLDFRSTPKSEDGQDDDANPTLLSTPRPGTDNPKRAGGDRSDNDENRGDSEEHEDRDEEHEDRD